MLNRVPAVRRKPNLRGGANRALLSIPKGARAMERVSLPGTPLDSGDVSADSRAPRIRFGPQPDVSPMGRLQGEEDFRRPADENRKLRAYLAPLFDALPCGVLIADSANRFRMANAAACRILFGSRARGVAGPAELARFESEMGRVLQSIAESGARYYRVGAAKRGRLIQVARICLTAEQGLAADRVYLLQISGGTRCEKRNCGTGATK